MDDQAGGDSGAVGMAAWRVEADVINLGTEGEVWKETPIHAAAEAVSELVAGAAAAANGDAGASDEALHKGRDMGGVVQRNARAEKIGVGVDRNAGRRTMIAADIRDYAEPAIGVIRNGAADAVLVESAGAAKAEIGIADARVNGLGARRNGEEEEAQA